MTATILHAGSVAYAQLAGPVLGQVDKAPLQPGWIVATVAIALALFAAVVCILGSKRGHQD